MNQFIFILALCFLFSNAATAADFTVTRSDDRNNPTCAVGDCSLREAIAAANAAAGADRIFFAPSLNNQTILLSSQLVTAGNDTLTITGRGANLLTIDGGGLYRVFNIGNQSQVTIADLKLTGGNGSNGGGAGIRAGNNTVITLERVNITGNNSPVSVDGGGVYFEGATLNIRNSTISGNKAANGAGIVHYGTGTMIIVNSTISNNTLVSGGSYGGGIAMSGNNILRNVTITGNSSEITKTASSGGGVTVFSGGSLNFANTIIAGNNAEAGKEISCFSQFMTSSGNNLVGDAAGDSTVFGVSFTYEPTDKRDINPMLGGLTTNNGGTTPTHALLEGSPAIDAGSNTLAVDPSNGNAPLRFDQRYYARFANGNLPGAIVDIGAYEFNAAPSAVSISGRVTFGSGATKRAIVSLTYASGVVKTALINPFGYFKFENVPAGQTVTIQVAAKGATFSPQIFTIIEDVGNLNFAPQP
ncbi:MAG: choice-of-anchor Q domain-containing protein [Pyrinomonadaceae bacterium]